MVSIEEGCYKKTIGQCANNDVEGEEAITMLTWFFMNNYTRCDKGTALSHLYSGNMSFDYKNLTGKNFHFNTSIIFRS